jgi:CBS domain-containing protein
MQTRRVQRFIDAAEVPVKAALRPLTISVREDQSLAQAARLLARHQLLEAPVLDAAGRCVGLISAVDLARFIAGSDD